MEADPHCDHLSTERETKYVLCNSSGYIMLKVRWPSGSGSDSTSSKLNAKTFEDETKSTKNNNEDDDIETEKQIL